MLVEIARVVLAVECQRAGCLTLLVSLLSYMRADCLNLLVSLLSCVRELAAVLYWCPCCRI